MARYPIVLSSMEEDFRKIGLLPELSETDDPTKPRDVPSPDPDTLGGLDDSEGEKSAHMAGAKQPKPKMGPDADDAEKSGYDPDEDGGGTGAQKGPKGSYSKVAGGKEASVESMQYSAAGKQPMSGKGKKQGEKTVIAKGLKPAKKVAGMMKEGRFTKAASLIEEVSGLLRSVQIDEEIDQLLHSFRLVAENAALLSDRLSEISEEFQVDDIVSQMEDLSKDAVEVIDIIENELEDVGGDEEDDEAIAHSSDVQEGKEGSDRNPDEPYDIPSPAFAVKEQSERVLNVMVNKLMDALEGYDNALVEMGMGDAGGDDDGDDEKEVHLHTKAKRVHVHHGHDDDDDSEDESHGGHEMSAHDGEDDGSEEDDGSGGEEDYGDEGDGEEGAEDHDDGGDGESDHDTHSLMAKMKALKARREAMSGGRSFRGSEEESY